MTVETPHEQEPKERRPVRTCAGCQKREDALGALVRVVLGNEEKPGVRGVIADVGASAFGRGAHVHASTACLKKACAGGFARAFKTGVKADPRELVEQIGAGCDRRIAGLVSGARRARKIAIGEEMGPAMSAGAPLAIVASDAGASVMKMFTFAIDEGRAVAWKDKVTLGSLLGRDEVAAVVVQDGGIASEILRARAMGSAARSQDGVRTGIEK